MKEEASTRSNHSSFWGNLLVVLGIISFLLFLHLLYERNNPQLISFDLSKNQQLNYSKIESTNLNPIGIKIDSLNLSLPIVTSEIKNNNWEVTKKGVSYLKSSVVPGEKGNSILYGHNWSNLLGNLKKAKVGDNITIIYSNGTVRNFEVEYLTKVSPNETSILKNSQDNRITLYTCTGFLDSQRLVVVAKLKA